MKFEFLKQTLNKPFRYGWKGVLLFLVLTGIFLTTEKVQSQTWSSNPGTSDWNTATNWDLGVPNSESALVTFGSSNNTSVTLSAGVSVAAIQFNAGAPVYTLTAENYASLSFFGAGIVNNSTSVPTLTAQLNEGGFSFYNSSTAGNAWIDGSVVSFMNNSMAGSATIEALSLSFNNNASAGHAVILYTYAGITFNDNSTAANATITDYGNYVGPINFLGSSTAANANITTSENIYFANNSTAGAATITVTNQPGISPSGSGELFFENNASGGTARIILNGTGGDNGPGPYGISMDISGDSSVTVGSIEGSGTIGLGGSNLTTGANNLNTTYSGIISDTSYYGGSGGTITKIGAGYWNLAGNNTYTGGTMIEGGGLALTGSGSLGTGPVYVDVSGTLDISGESSGLSVTISSLAGYGQVNLGDNNLILGLNNLNSAFAGNIDGGGSLTKIGTGTCTLLGFNQYNGIFMTGGSLVVGGADALGNGSVVVSGGTLATLGGPLGVNVGGNYTQTSAGILQLGLAGTGAGQWDNLQIIGSARLGGTLQLVSDSGFQIQPGDSFVLLAANGGIQGGFTRLIDPFSGPRLFLAYEPQEVILETILPSFAQIGVTSNQKSVGSLLDKTYMNLQNNALIISLIALPNSSLPAAYNQLSPSSLTPMYQIGFAVAQAQAGMVGGRLSQIWGNSDSSSNNISWNGNGPMFAGTLSASQEAGMAQNAQPDRWGVFANGIGNFGTVASDGNGAGYQYSTGGMTAGVDYRFAKSLVGGLLFSYNQSGTSQSTGSVNVTGGEAGLYGGWKEDSVHVEVLAEGGLNQYTTQRGGYGGTAVGSTQGQEYSGQISAGYDWKIDQTKIGPFVSGQYTRVNINGFSESGSLAPLSYGTQNEDYLSSDLGASASRGWNLGGLTLSPSISAAWEHVYQGNLDSLNAGLPGGNFTVNGPAIGTDAAVLGAGLNAQFETGLNAFVQYQGKVGLTNYTEQSFSAGVNIGF